MKKFLSMLIVIAICITILPSTVFAAPQKYIVNADAKYTIAVNETITLYVNTKKSITWSSSDKSIATVSKKGIVTGKGDGLITITAKVGKDKYKCTVVINDYSKWIPYSTSDSKALAQNILDGKVVFYGNQYLCSPAYFDMLSNVEIVSSNDISNDTPSSDRYSLSDENIVIPNDTSNTDLDGLN